VALDRALRVDALGRVDPDETDPLDPAAGHLDVERVAVDDRDHEAAVGRAVGVAAAPASAGGRGHGGDDEQREDAQHEGLPS
jgi:hypothetical protein